MGGVAGGVISYDGGIVTLQNLENSSDFSAPMNANAGEILGALVIAGRDESEATFTIQNCANIGDITKEREYAKIGGICGSFLEGVGRDDWHGVLELDNVVIPFSKPSKSPENGTAHSVK